MISPPDGMLSLESVLLPLTAALGMALVVERVVEFLKNLVDMIPTTSNAAIIERKEVSDAQIAKLKNFHEAADSQDGEVVEEHPPETIIVQDANDPDQGTTLRSFVIQATAVVAGIIAARVGDVRLFEALTPSSSVLPAADYLLTGLFIGGGSGPAHVLIRFITERKVAVTEDTDKAEASEAPKVVAIAAEDAGMRRVALAAFSGPASVAIDAALDIPYSGGVDRDKLQSVHHRGVNPNMIVFHHTAMHLKSTFEDVVKVIKNRKDNSGKNWITGYNCVVTHDGGIHPFCRWDRYGNHAAGFNKRSLGITINGNFETDARVPFSNAGGKYGAPRPTEQQLDAAARTVALWLFLYPDIPLLFDREEEGIVPHNNVSPKTCPGNMFPYEQFEKLVRHYHVMWGNSAAARERIEAYKLRPYLYVNPKVIPPPRIVPPISMAGLPAPVATVQPVV